MPAGSTLRSFTLGTLLAAVLVVTLAGTAKVTGLVAHGVLAYDATATARRWARQLEGARRDLPALLAGEAAIVDHPAMAEEGGQLGILRYRVLGPDDRARLVSAPEEPGQPVRGGVGRVPLLVAGVQAGTVEVEVDQGDLATYVTALVWLAGCLVLLFAGFGFSAPLFALLHSARGRETANRRIRYLDRHDPLTDLPNRAGFTAALDGLAQAHRATGERIALVYVDLAGVQAVNDLFGHAAGDAAIRAAAADLAAAAGPGAVVGRLGGDEFAVARAGLPTLGEAEALARAVLGAVCRPRRIEGQDVTLGAHAGIAATPWDGRDAAELMKSAHVALSHAKPKGSGAVAIFDRRMDDEVQLRRQVEQRVREALATDSFDLHFQPVMAGPTGRLLGFEALLRLPDGPGGFVSPAVFVPVAEEIGLISAIGAFVLRRACQCAAGWPEHLTVAVNLSPEQFRDGSAVTAVRAALARSGLKPHRLELEITESLLLADSEAVLADLAELQAMGVAIVMDDFGTGYSSLSYLWKFPFAKVKIDRSFLRGLDGRDASAFRGTPVDGILRAVLSLSRSLRLRVTAEGVETEAQAAFLRDLGCDELQGFLFGRPMPAGEADALALRDRRWGGEPAVVALHAVR